MTDDTYYSMTADDLRDELLGHAITSIDAANNQLTLDDGRTLTFEDDTDCCSWFNANLVKGNLTSNGITDVTLSGEECPSEGEGAWTIHILAANRKVADLNIDGNASSGYYCHSIKLTITGASS